jgi:hypothetical protein
MIFEKRWLRPALFLLLGHGIELRGLARRSHFGKNLVKGLSWLTLR